ncbi:MAG: reductase [Flavobacterium sp.]|nr:MAG: reductase [Flavobacterium sp.]
MRKIIVQQWISLDGFATDREGTTKFFENPDLDYSGIHKDQLELFETIDAAILGATTYKMFAEYWPTEAAKGEPVTPKINVLKKIVFSKKMKDASWEPATICRDDLTDAVRNLKNSPGKNIVIWGSLSICEALANENLIDEYLLYLVPAFIGKGRQFFPDDKELHNMDLYENKTFDGGIVSLKYRVKPKK